MESWRKVWRQGIMPQISTECLEAALIALETDDKRLLQGKTTSPPPLARMQDWDCEGACLIGFCGWQGNALATAADVKEFFAKVCYDADQALGEPAAVRYFLNIFDDWSRDEMIREMTEEVTANLAERRQLEGAA